ncbi:hypothetical protein CPT_Sitrop_018 [Streptomyces phage Sitrop]|uniref:Uncharacterized protein n=1 Tax=Streptomyces phage Sitrop TaxID=2767587 RepID=A0A873WHS5_9CAUD|nr:hypothetical protein KGG96_gp18 [Streptomyces phage Sitrop]QPB09933.1 hypothetical protein CPT_Sitrop_018 [Streptomyces phage Sitrop]
MGASLYPPPNMLGGWTAFTPRVFAAANLTTPVAASPNAAVCKYKYLDADLVVAHAEVALTAAVVGIHLELPVPASHRQIQIGTALLWGTGVPADQTGMAYMSAQLGHVIIAAASAGFRDAASGQTMRYHVTYQV